MRRGAFSGVSKFLCDKIFAGDPQVSCCDSFPDQTGVTPNLLGSTILPFRERKYAEMDPIMELLVIASGLQVATAHSFCLLPVSWPHTYCKWLSTAVQLNKYLDIL